VRARWMISFAKQRLAIRGLPEKSLYVGASQILRATEHFQKLCDRARVASWRQDLREGWWA
jgi:hypothetical protein